MLLSMLSPLHGFVAPLINFLSLPSQFQPKNTNPRGRAQSMPPIFPNRLPLFLSFSLLALFSVSCFASELSVVSHPSNLTLPPGSPVEGSPGARAGAALACSRIHIHGFSRLRHPSKYAHALRVKLSASQEDALFRTQTLELCFHRNASIGLGMCPAAQWQKLSKNSWYWVQRMSPYEHMILDLRRHPEPARLIEVSTEKEFLVHRVVFLVLGLVMMFTSRTLSESVVFYYGGAMTLGIILVILIILFQGMKLLPTGRRSSLAIFFYSSLVGVGTFLLSYLSGLLRMILVEIGVNEDMHNPVSGYSSFSVPCAGWTWFGYWGVRKLVLTEEGIVDSSVAYFVEWAILIFSAVLILESSLDTLFAVEALGLSIFMLALTRIHGKSRFVCRLYRRTIRNIGSWIQFSPFKPNNGEYSKHLQNREFVSPRSQANSLRLASTSPISGLMRSPFQRPAEDTYYSTFHSTPDRKKYSKKEWDEFTREETKKAMRRLVSSPDFNQWALANVDRISVTPTGEHKPELRRCFFRWF